MNRHITERPAVWFPAMIITLAFSTAIASAEDRTELNNLAAKHPERVAAMSKQWHGMAENVLLAPPGERKPVATQKGNMLNFYWSDYSGKHGSLTSPWVDGSPIYQRKKK